MASPVSDRMPRSRWAGARLTEAEYLALPEEKPYLELHDGLVVQKAVPNTLHRRLVAELVLQFALYVRLHGGDLGPEGRVRLASGRYHLPDAAYWAPGRPNGDDSVPTVAVEVRSPDDTMNDQRAKCVRYRQAGVEVAWLIDPGTRTVEVYDDTNDGTVLGVDDALETPAMPGFRLPLVELFAVLDRP
jgi:Uma2 family endonuclease